MEVIFESADAHNTPESEQSRAQAVRRIRSAMRSMGWLVRRAHVKLSGGSELSGSIDKQCQVELLTEGGDKVVITSLARDWHSALHSALARASKSLLHRWQQKNGSLTPSRNRLSLSMVA